MSRPAALALAAALLVAAPGPLLAQRRPSVNAEITQARSMIESRDPAQMQEAVLLLGGLQNPAVVPVLADLLRSGAPDAATDEALEALKSLAHPSAMDVLVEFTNHRRTAARRTAYEAIALIRHRDRQAILEECLTDSDRGIRGQCALALGDIGAKSALDTLFRAFERGVTEAAVSIGKLGGERDVDRFDAFLGQQPLVVMLNGYREFLQRRDIAADRKVQVVTGKCPDQLAADRERRRLEAAGRTTAVADAECEAGRLYGLGQIGGPQVRNFLLEYLNATDDAGNPIFPPETSNPSELQIALEESIRAIPEDPNVQGERVGGGN